MKKGLIAGAPLIGAALVSAAVAWPTVATARDEVRLHPKLNGRVNELEQELRIMKNRMKAIERRQARRGKSPGIYASRTKKRVRLRIDGQVHRAVLFGAQPQNTEVQHVDGDQSSTRLRFRGDARLGGGWKVEARIEFEIENSDSNGTRDATPNLDDFNLRKARIKFSHKRWGSLSMGREDTATNGIAEIDFAGTVAMYSDVETVGGGFVHNRNPAQQTGSSAGTTIAAAWNHFDGQSRRDLIRYDSPKFYGFWVSASHANQDRLSLAIRYVGTLFGWKEMKWAFGFGYDYLPGQGSTCNTALGCTVAGDNTGPRQQYSGSTSLHHVPSGFIVTFAMGTQVRGGGARRNPVSMYLKVAWVTKALLDAGKTTFMVDAFRANHVAANDANFQGFGVGAVQKIDKGSLEIYVVYRFYDLVLGRAASAAARNQGSIHVFMVGSRMKF